MNTTKTTPRVPGVYVPSNVFALDLTVGVLASLASIEVVVTDPRFIYQPSVGAEISPITAQLCTPGMDELLVTQCKLTNDATGEVTVRFMNTAAAGVDFNDRFVVFFIWPPVAEP